VTELHGPQQLPAAQLHEMGIGEILDVAIKIYRRNAWTLFRIVLVVITPLSLLANIIVISAIPAHVTSRVELVGNQFLVVKTLTTAQWHTLIVGLAAAGVLSMIGYLVATGAAYKAVAEAFLGGRPNWKSSLAFAFRRAHSLLWVSVLGGLIAGIASLLCFIPGIYLGVAFAVAIPAVMTEDVRGRRALGRSRRLVKGRWWRTLALLLLGALLSIVLFYGVLLLERLVISDAGPRTVVGVVLNVLTSTVLSALVIPFAAAYITVLYFDLRVRREAFDLQLLALEVGVDAAPLPPAT
jgi:hypothetical protein